MARSGMRQPAAGFGKRTGRGAFAKVPETAEIPPMTAAAIALPNHGRVQEWATG